MRYPASEKLEIIRIVEQSHLSARQTLDRLGIPRPTFYRWYLLHVASPMSAERGGDLLGPARDGALRVLRAATEAGAPRVVLTSSTAAAAAAGVEVNDERSWTDPTEPHLNAYRISKILAERAAWDFMAEHGGRTALTTILPSAVFGPVLRREDLGSVQLIDRLIKGAMPAVPRIGFCVVDVRDLAAAHVAALTSPEAPGERFIAAGEHLWFSEVARLLADGLGPAGARVPTRALPDLLVRLGALFSPEMAMLTPMLGRKFLFSAEKAKRVLGFSPRPAATTLLDCANSLLDRPSA